MALFGRKDDPRQVMPDGQAQQMTPRHPAGSGIPGVEREDPLQPQVAQMLLTRKAGTQVIGKEDVRKAIAVLKKYKDGKQNLETRIVEDELWWELRHWEAIGKGGRSKNGEPLNRGPEPTSAWLFNAILNKHADAMDNFPEPVVLPRERDDQDSAKTLSEVLPVILEANEYEQTYSDNWWEKLKHGTAAYGVFWNTDKENGLGDIDIRQIDLLKLFWEPGISDIQKSRNLFIVELVDDDLLDLQYPEHTGKLKAGQAAVDVRQYLYGDQVDITNKSVVVDWYYKVKGPDGRTVLHYAKFVGDELLYASENDPDYALRGFYDHGLYPVVLDCLFPEKGTPVGFGYVAICKDPQLYIDKLFGNILENSMMATKRRYFVSASTAINEEDFMDWNKPLVRVEGEINDARVKEIVTSPLSDIYVQVAQQKIEEMKDTVANRDVNSGGTSSSVTAAAAIAALQEAGNKASRDMIATSYRSHQKIASLCIELIRQFYDEKRTFRITGTAGGGYEFVGLSNATLKDQVTGVDTLGNQLFRRPIFDLKIKAQKQNPFSRMEQNERAKELYGMGFFNAENAQQALMALEMMDFEGIEQLKEKIKEGQTLLNLYQQAMMENMALKAALGIVPAPGTGQEPITPPTGQAQGSGTGEAEDSLASRVMAAHTPMTSYGDRLAKRSGPDMDAR